MKHLIYSYYDNDKHALKAIKEAGITYQYSIAQTMGDCWQFLYCDNIPDPLPKGFNVFDLEDVRGLIGHGLSEAMADHLIEKNKESQD